MTTGKALTASPGKPSGDTSSNSTMDQLMEWLAEMMSLVRVTNPIARQDPSQAILTMAKICSKFPIPVVRKAIDDIVGSGDAPWPTAGEMNVALRMAYESLNPPRAKSHQPRRGGVVEAVVAKSEAGRMALDNGYFGQLLADLKANEVTLTGATSPMYIKRCTDLVLKRMADTEHLRSGTGEFANMPLPLREQLISLSAVMSARNAAFRDKYSPLDV